MSAAHTPGPWVYGNWSTGKHGEMPDSGWVDVWAPTEAGNGLPFAACKHGDVEANARLIAAAPDLLAFVAEYLEAWRDGMAGDSYLLRLAEQAHAKATGSAT